MKLTLLGTGNALAIDCYNTCFLLEDKEEQFPKELEKAFNLEKSFV